MKPSYRSDCSLIKGRHKVLSLCRYTGPEGSMCGIKAHTQRKFLDRKVTVWFLWNAFLSQVITVSS